MSVVGLLLSWIYSCQGAAGCRESWCELVAAKRFHSRWAERTSAGHSSPRGSTLHCRRVPGSTIPNTECHFHPQPAAASLTRSHCCRGSPTHHLTLCTSSLPPLRDGKRSRKIFEYLLQSKNNCLVQFYWEAFRNIKDCPVSNAFTNIHFQNTF